MEAGDLGFRSIHSLPLLFSPYLRPFVRASSVSSPWPRPLPPPPRRSFSQRRGPPPGRGFERPFIRGSRNSRALSCSEAPCRCSSTRRSVVGAVVLGVSSSAFCLQAFAGGPPPEEKPKLCDDACVKELENVPMVITESGLQFKDIIVGQGPSPPIGFQVLTLTLFFFFLESCCKLRRHGATWADIRQLTGERPALIFRVGAGQVIKGLDEGLLSMKVGGLRRLYIPGPLAFPKGLTSAPGRPRVAPRSPVIFDVNLLFIPGLDDE